MKQHLTVLGDRQSGKTTALIRLAVMEAAIEGQRVLYTSYSGAVAEHHFKMTVDWLYESIFRNEIVKVSRTNGQQRITFRSGGTIFFPPPSKSEFRGYTPNVHIMDSDDFAEAHISAERVYRGVMR